MYVKDTHTHKKRFSGCTFIYTIYISFILNKKMSEVLKKKHEKCYSNVSGCGLRKLPGHIFKYYYQKYNIQSKALLIQLGIAQHQQPIRMGKRCDITCPYMAVRFQHQHSTHHHLKES